MKKLVSVTLMLLLTGAAFASSEPPNLRTIKKDIYRSGRPTEQGLRQLVQVQGIRTVINLENDMSNVQEESRWAQQLGIRYVSIPMSAWTTPKDRDVDHALQLLEDESLQPILIHCRHGRDRTGLIVGLYRVFHDGWLADKAYREMLDLGFRRILFPLDNYFKEKTAGKELFVPYAIAN